MYLYLRIRRINIIGGYVSVWKKVVVVYFKICFQNLPGGTEEITVNRKVCKLVDSIAAPLAC
jgi:hypothetical protein